MPGFEEEAFLRAQRINHPKPNKEAESIFEPKKPKEKPPAPNPPSPKPPEQKAPEPEANQQKPGLLDSLFKDKEKSIILALMLLLGDESSDPSLLLALAYLLM